MATIPLHFQDSLAIALGGESVSCVGQVPPRFSPGEQGPCPHANHPRGALCLEPSRILGPITTQGKTSFDREGNWGVAKYVIWPGSHGEEGAEPGLEPSSPSPSSTLTRAAP